MDRLRSLTSNKTAMIGGGIVLMLVGISAAVFIGISNRENYMAKADDDEASSFDIPDEPLERSSSGGGQYVDSLSFLRGQRKEAAAESKDEAPAQGAAPEAPAPQKEEEAPRRQVAKLEGMSLPASAQQSQSQQSGMGQSQKLSKLSGTSTTGIKSLSSGGGLKGFGSKISSRRGAVGGSKGKKSSGSSTSFGFGSSGGASGGAFASGGSAGISGGSSGSDSSGLASGSISSNEDSSSSNESSGSSGSEGGGEGLDDVGINTSSVTIAAWDCGSAEDGDGVDICITNGNGDEVCKDWSYLRHPDYYSSSCTDYSDPSDSCLKKSSKQYYTFTHLTQGENTIVVTATVKGSSGEITGCLRYLEPSELDCGTDQQSWKDMPEVGDSDKSTVNYGTGCSE
ncbi:MAG: hypothetical protein HY547_03310 [Elusimicrobia bacterium]|nr:hypothetical protein [Elusimicrobiota bacterium]